MSPFTTETAVPGLEGAGPNTEHLRSVLTLLPACQWPT